MYPHHRFSFRNKQNILPDARSDLELCFYYSHVTIMYEVKTKLRRRSSEQLYMHVRMHAHTLSFVSLNYCTKY